jgi:hypothetical protein
VIAVTTSVTTDETTDTMTDVAKTTTTATTTVARSDLCRHHLKGQPQRCVPVNQPRDQLRCWRSLSDQKQQTDPIKRKGDRACQH